MKTVTLASVTDTVASIPRGKSAEPTVAAHPSESCQDKHNAAKRTF